MAIQRVNFNASTGDQTGAALVKLDANDADLQSQVTAAQNSANTANSVLSGAGWDSTLAIIPNIDNATATPRVGYYAYGTSSGGMPNVALYGTIMTLKYQNVAYSQLAQSITGNELCLRYFNNSAWSAWKRIWHEGNTTVDANLFIKRAN